MFRRFTEPREDDFDTHEEYLEELRAYEDEEYWRTERSMEEYFDQKFANQTL